MIYDLLIIGAGPAGMTAAIYAKRANLKVAIFEGNVPGGQMVNTSEIENYPGFGNVGGADLALEMLNHSLALEIEYIFENVVEIKEDKVKVVITDSAEYQTKAVIIATGATPRKLGLEHEDMLASRGISWCAICDWPLYKGKDVVVVGGGNSAVEEANYLATLAKSVTVIQNLDRLTADKKTIDILLKKTNVKVYYNSLVKEFIVNEKFNLTKVLIEDNNGKKTYINTDGVFEYIGLKPMTVNFKNLEILNDYGYIKTDESMRTAKAGIYAVGDVREKEIRQIVTATNDGAIAVQNVLKYLETWV